MNLITINKKHKELKVVTQGGECHLNLPGPRNGRRDTALGVGSGKQKKKKISFSHHFWATLRETEGLNRGQNCVYAESVSLTP